MDTNYIHTIYVFTNECMSVCVRACTLICRERIFVCRVESLRVRMYVCNYNTCRTEKFTRFDFYDP